MSATRTKGSARARSAQGRPGPARARARIAELERRAQDLEHCLVHATGGWESAVKLLEATEGGDWDDDLQVIARLRALAAGERPRPSLASYVLEIEEEIDRYPDRHPDELDETEAAEAAQLIARLRAIVTRRRASTSIEDGDVWATSRKQPRQPRQPRQPKSKVQKGREAKMRRRA